MFYFSEDYNWKSVLDGDSIDRLKSINEYHEILEKNFVNIVSINIANRVKYLYFITHHFLQV